jgi:hypothetical protein
LIGELDALVSPASLGRTESGLTDAPASSPNREVHGVDVPCDFGYHSRPNAASSFRDDPAIPFCRRIAARFVVQAVLSLS